MNDHDHARHIVDRMYANDHFSQWLGLQPLAVSPGACTLRLTVRREMLNGFGIAHGAITYALADSALAFASNSRGRHAVSVETSISHTAPLLEGEVITAVATEESLSNRIAIYRVEVRNQEDKVVALFKGTVYRKDQEWEKEEV